MISIQRTRILSLVGILGAMFAYACGSDAETPTTRPAADGGVTNDSGTTGDAATGDASDAAAPSTKGGSVSFVQSKPAAVYTTTAAAGFYNAPPVVVARTGCTAAVVGACTVTECDPPVAPGDAGAPANDAGPAPTAGDITITGGLIPAAGIVLTASDDGTYAAKNGAAQAFQGGETLTVKAAGSATGAPAFEGKVVAPTDIVVTPALSFVTPTAVSRTTDFKFNWTAGGAGDVSLLLNTTQTDQRSVIIACKAAASAGTITVPQAAVAKLFATSATLNGVISATPTNAAQTTAGDFKVGVTATGNTVTGSMTTN